VGLGARAHQQAPLLVEGDDRREAEALALQRQVPDGALVPDGDAGSS
jgi:hypothetical protein